MSIEEVFLKSPFNQNFLISNLGKAYYDPSKCYCKPIHQNGLNWASYGNEYVCITVSVAFLFLDQNDPNRGEDILRINGNLYDDTYTNLRWIKRISTMTNSISRNSVNIKSNLKYMSLEDIHRICYMLEQGAKPTEIVSSFSNYDISHAHMVDMVSRIKRGVMYKEISDQYNFEKGFSNKRYSLEEKHAICKLIASGMGTSDIAKTLGVDYTPSLASIVCAVKKKRQWKEIADLYF